MVLKYVSSIYGYIFSLQSRKRVEKAILYFATISFIIHIVLIFLIRTEILPFYYYNEEGTLPNLISTIYTPFSIILLYEIYGLIYYLPKSLLSYLGKQYEIISLIFIRGIFDDLAHFTNDQSYFNVSLIKDLLFTLLVFALLLLLIFFYYKISGSKQIDMPNCDEKAIRYYIRIKKVLAVLLLFVFIFLFLRSLFQIYTFPTLNFTNVMSVFKYMNNSFFDIFFTALILSEVFLLLFMYNMTDDFDKIFRNSGFVISTVLLKLSFRTEGLTNIFIMLIAVFFGVVVLQLYNLFRKKL